MTPIATMDVDPSEAARGLGITIDEYISMREDGRKAIMYAGDYLACHGFQKLPNLSGHLFRRAGVIYKLRVLTDHVAFSESAAKGVGRNFSFDAFMKGLGRFHRFLVFDAKEMPQAKFYEISKEQVHDWMINLIISPTAVADRAVILKAFHA